MNPFGCRFELLVQIGLAFEYQLHDHFDGAQQEAVDQSVADAAEQAEKKSAAIRHDKTPELAEKINHGAYFSGKATVKRAQIFRADKKVAAQDGAA